MNVSVIGKVYYNMYSGVCRVAKNVLATKVSIQINIGLMHTWLPIRTRHIHQVLYTHMYTDLASLPTWN